jgi:hypothetical protein
MALADWTDPAYRIGYARRSFAVSWRVWDGGGVRAHASKEAMHSDRGWTTPLRECLRSIRRLRVNT